MITLQHRTVEEMLPLLRPHFPPPAVLSGMGSQLVVNATPEQLASLRGLLAALDTRPRDVMIFVDRGGGGQFQDQDQGVILQGSDRQVRGGVRVGQQSGSRQEASTQQIRVMEGGRAFIQVGETRPLQQVQQRRVGGVLVEERRTVQQSAGQGVYVEPRLAGDRVTLAIHPVNSRFVDAHGSRQVEEAQTVIQGRLGEWMALGGLNQDRSQNQSGILNSQRHADHSTRTIRVKVELADGP